MKKFFQYSVLAIVGLFGALWLKALYYTGLYNEDLYKELLKHTAATVGLPLSALAALGIVIILEIYSGDIEFEALGFKFKGASGPVILWVICFLSISGAIKILW